MALTEITLCEATADGNYDVEVNAPCAGGFIHLNSGSGANFTVLNSPSTGGTAYTAVKIAHADASGDFSYGEILKAQTAGTYHVPCHLGKVRVTIAGYTTGTARVVLVY